MTILVECNCGQKFSIETDYKRHKTNDESATEHIGSGKCPNPQCDRTVHVDAIFYTQDNEPEVTGTINWDEIRNVDDIYFSGIYYSIIFKGIIRSKKILYLSSFQASDRIVVEVNDEGELKQLCSEPDKIIPFGAEPTSQEDCKRKWFGLIKEAITQEEKE